MILSASSINTYNDCHLQWYFTYVERRPAESEAMTLGQGVHDYAEARLKGEDITVLEKPEVIALLEVFDRDIMPTYGEAVLVEAAFELDVEGVTYTGFIDSVDAHVGPLEQDGPFLSSPANYIVRDLKTSKSRPRPDKYRDPLIGYYLGARELGYPADELQLDYIVKTKKPYYWPEVQPVPDDDEIDVWAGQVARVAASIEMADWEPTGVGTWHCSTCPHKDICGPYDRWLEMTSPIRKEAR